MINIGVTLTLTLSLTTLHSILNKCNKRYLYLVFTAIFTSTVFILIKRKLNTYSYLEKTADDSADDLFAEVSIEMETQQTSLKLNKWSLNTMMRTSRFLLMFKLEVQSLLCGPKNLTWNGNQRSKSVQTQPLMKKSPNFIWLNKSTSTKMLFVWTWSIKRSSKVWLEMLLLK